MKYRWVGELEKKKSDSSLDIRMISNLLKIKYKDNISNSNDRSNSNKKKNQNNPKPNKITIVIIQIVMKRWWWWINIKRNNFSPLPYKPPIHPQPPPENPATVYCEHDLLRCGMTLWPAQVPCPGSALSSFLVHLHGQNMGNWEVLGLRVSIAQQQLKYQCVIDIILLLSSKHSTVPATKKKLGQSYLGLILF